MRKMTFVVGALSVAVAVVFAGCGSGPGDQQRSTSAGAAGAAASSAGAGGGATGATSGVAGSSGRASGGSATASGGSSGGGGAAGAPPNVYIVQLRTNVANACMPRELPFGATGGPSEGRVSCTIAELHFGACDCKQPGRAALSGDLLTASASYAEQSGSCGGPSGVDCAAACGCELVQLPGTAVDTSSALYACQNDVAPATDLAGFCVIDQERMDPGGPAPIGNPEIVADCPSDSHRRIRFVGQDVPSADAAVFITCSAPVSAD